MGWDVVQWVKASDRHAADAGSNPRCGKGFSSQSHLSVQTLFSMFVHPRAIVCINIGAHDKDPVIHVRVRWFVAVQTYPARAISDKNNQRYDCGLSSAMSMLLQHGHIRAP